MEDFETKLAHIKENFNAKICGFSAQVEEFRELISSFRNRLDEMEVTPKDHNSRLTKVEKATSEFPGVKQAVSNLIMEMAEIETIVSKVKDDQAKQEWKEICAKMEKSLSEKVSEAMKGQVKVSTDVTLLEKKLDGIEKNVEELVKKVAMMSQEMKENHERFLKKEKEFDEYPPFWIKKFEDINRGMNAISTKLNGSVNDKNAVVVARVDGLEEQVKERSSQVEKLQFETKGNFESIMTLKERLDGYDERFPLEEEVPDDIGTE